MSIPAVGVIVALAYVAVIDNPERFRRSGTVGAYLGLTPRRYQSGDVDCAGRISKCGDGLLRAYLFQAANAILTRKVTDSTLRRWGHALVARGGRPVMVVPTANTRLDQPVEMASIGALMQINAMKRDVRIYKASPSNLGGPYANTP
jgi:transposase